MKNTNATASAFKRDKQEAKADQVNQARISQAMTACAFILLFLAGYALLIN